MGSATVSQTELSFTRPRTESSCKESWLTRFRTCMAWLWVTGLLADSIPGGDGASSGVKNWWFPISSFKGIMSVKTVSEFRFGIEDGGVGWPSAKEAHGALMVVFPGSGGSSAVTVGSVCRSGVAAACKTNLVLWMHWSWSHWRMEGYGGVQIWTERAFQWNKIKNKNTGRCEGC